MAENNTNGTALNDSELEQVSGGGLSIADTARGKAAMSLADQKCFAEARTFAEAIADNVYRQYVVNYINSKQIFTSTTNA